MKRTYIFYIILFLVLILIFKFSQAIFYIAFRFWYISIPLVIYLFWRYRAKRKERIIGELDPKNEIKTYPPPTFEDDENGKE